MFTSFHLVHPSTTPYRERHLEVVQVQDCTIDDDLKELIGTTYTDKMHLIFDCLSHKNSTVKHVWLGIIMGWMTFWKFCRKTWLRKKKHAEKCRVSLWGQSLILKVVETYCRDLKKDYIRKILTCREFWPTRMLSEALPCEVS